MSDDRFHGTPDVWPELFSSINTDYSESPNTQNRLFEKVKLSFLQKQLPKPPQKILEVGCGTAYVSLYLAKRGYKATCLDINDKVLQIAKTNFSKEKVSAKFIKATAEKLPFPNRSFDAVLSFGLLEHFADPSIAIDQMSRVLKPGGIFFADIVPSRFSVQTLGNFWNFMASVVYWSLKGKFKTGFLQGLRNFKPAYYENSLSWHEYRNMMAQVGLKNIGVYGNRPFPRLTLPEALDRMYAAILKPFISWWLAFDRSQSSFSRFWGAGWWFVAKKI